ncbi:VacJ family lipoprotein [Aquabacterium sp. CECT 9606]|uniref:MlaA family lipoprotein n=1 Tax=Aquabacterium sp. CECT 9606 TaxID=2845822 RepID=UPI001E59A8E4|nr:VacJ family lipoprotein [Aquabacterium sp. CECT 9606]CAH0348687.1 Intermembrane phospholipid transport system lipoprotein MlaA [Aquabacterium sp. CECT 9606]
MNQNLDWVKTGLGGLVIASTALLQGCATRQNPDPLESMNRKVFSFNQSLDDNVLKPVATGYKAVTPQPVRTAISNFGGNFKDLWSALNLFLQGHPGDGATQVMRVSVNTTLGLAGLIDIATPMRLERQSEDFGQTLGVWGVKPGAYIVWPFLGPSTLRDSVSIPGDLYFSPRLVLNDETANVVSILQVINARASVLDVTNLLGDVALDPYSFVRDAYLQRRQSQVYNGEPPEEDEEDYDSDPAAAPVAPQSKVDAEKDGPHWSAITVAELQGLRADEFVR